MSTMTYYLLDAQEVFSRDKLIKVKSEAITPELKALAQAAAQRENLKDVAVIFFHTTCCSANRMGECMTAWQSLTSGDKICEQATPIPR